MERVAWHRCQDLSVMKRSLWGCVSGHGNWILVMYKRINQISMFIEDNGSQVSPFQRRELQI